MPKKPDGTWKFPQKIKFVMFRLTFILAILMMCTFPAASNGQEVSLHIQKGTLEDVFDKLSRQTSVRIVFNPLSAEKIVVENVNYDRIDLKGVLDGVLKGTALYYDMVDGTFVIKERQALQQPPTGKIVGSVLDSSGAPLIGATIILKGTQRGSITDTQGHFEISGVSGAKVTISVSYLGKRTTEVEVEVGTTTIIRLEDNMVEVSNVVVIGYFNRTKQSITGSEVTVSGEELRQVGSLNFMNALSVFDPSVRPIPNNEYGSDPNRIPDVVIRGENGFDLRSSADDSRSNPNSPLYILDGIEVSATRVYDLDMNRIEAFSILKDASATALYGSRGANGVILIQTISPREGEIKVTINANYNISIPDLRDYNLMNAAEKLAYEKLAGLYTAKWATGATQDELDLRYNHKLAEISRGVDTYWLSRPLRTSVNQRYNAFIEGGDSRFRYGIDLTYDNDKGVMKGSDRERIGANFNFSYNVGSKLRIVNDISVYNVEGQNSPYGAFSAYAKLNPYERIYDPETGEMIRRFGYGDAQDIVNPLRNSLLPNYDKDNYTEIKDNLSLEWRVTDHFLVRGRAGITKNIRKTEAYMSPYSTAFDLTKDADDRGGYTSAYSNKLNFDGSLTAQYNNIFAEKFSLSAGVGVDITTLNLNGDGYTASGFLNDDMNFVQYAQKFKENSKPTGVFDKMRTVGFLANVNIGYDNRYFIDASFRTDGSSRFGRESRFAPFWSAGVAWNLDREKWWNGESTMKVRGSVGSTGSVNFAPDQAITKYIYGPAYEYNGYNGAILSGYGNPALKWQSTLKYNVGVELSIMRSAIVLNVDFYVNKTQNLLLDIDVAPSTGFLSYKENMGSIQNVGGEMRVRFNLIRNSEQDLFWSLTLMAAANRNKILSLSNALQAMNEQANQLENVTSSNPLRNYQAGRSQSALMLVRSNGIDPATGNEIYVKRNGDMTFDYDPRDKIFVGDTNPKVQGNIQTNLSYKGFDLFLAFNYEYGAVLYNNTLASKVEGTVIETTENGVKVKGIEPRFNADKRALYERWKTPGDIAMFRRINDETAVYQTTRLVQDNNFINLQSLSLSYNVPQHMLKNIFLERVKFTFTATDLFRISTVKIERGTSYPFAQTFSLGATVTF